MNETKQSQARTRATTATTTAHGTSSATSPAATSAHAAAAASPAVAMAPFGAAGAMDDALMWLGYGNVESWHDERYYYDCRQRQGQQHVVLQLTLQGGAFHHSQAFGRRLVMPGQAFIDHIPGPFSYGYATEVGGVYKQIFLSIAGQQARQWCEEITSRFGHVLDIGLGSPIHHMMASLVHQRRNAALRADRYIVSAHAYQLFMTLLSHLTQSRLSQTPRVSDALSIIHQQAADPTFGVSTLAAQLGWSREYLSRQFKHVLGTSPLQAITRWRLDQACSLLRKSEGKLDVIAAACGFASANYLCRTFRLHFGVTPAQYRQQPQMVLRHRMK